MRHFTVNLYDQNFSIWSTTIFSIFGQPKFFRFLAKNLGQIFLFWSKISILGQIFHFRSNFWLLLNFRFWVKIFWSNFDFWPKLRFLSKISIFDQNFDVWPKFRFLTQISIFNPNFDFCPKFRFLSEISIFDHNFDFCPTFRFLTKISLFRQTFYFWTLTILNSGSGSILDRKPAQVSVRNWPNISIRYKSVKIKWQSAHRRRRYSASNRDYLRWHSTPGAGWTAEVSYSTLAYTR